jgi:predicted RNA methylase
MKLKSLEMLMESIEGFDSPKVLLEQYPTGTHIASRILYTIDTTFDDIRDKSIADLGSGSGRLTIGSALCGAHHVLGIDCDIIAINKCLDNCQQFEDNIINKIDMICADVCEELFWKRFHKCFDCVLMNPPFGTKRNKGFQQFVHYLDFILSYISIKSFYI